MNNIDNMFEKASKLKLRFNTTRGIVSTEDLWDTPLQHTSGFSLDDMAQHIHTEIEATAHSFVSVITTENTTLQLKFEIIKHIIKVKLRSRDIAAKTKATKEKRAKILAAIAEIDDVALKQTSKEDLLKMLDEEV